MTKKTMDFKSPKSIVSIVLIIVFLVVALLTGKTNLLDQFLGKENSLNSQTIVSSQQNNTSTLQDLTIYYLDVGQADCEILQLPNGETMVIDAGNNPDGKLIVDFLKNDLKITKIDYLIGTHPHEDHIGGLDNIINEFDVVNFYMPKISDNDMPTTATYKSVLESAIKKNIPVTQGKGGLVPLDKNGLKIEFLAPNSTNYGNLNNYSIVTKITYNNKSFLFNGDAETPIEKEMMDMKYDVSADVLKLGHHGSSSSSSLEFLKAVNPSTVIISCGKDNKYGHPHKETLQSIKDLHLESYRTDTQSTIIATCDGTNINFTTKNISCDGNT